MKKIVLFAFFFSLTSFFSVLLAQTSVLAHAKMPFPIEKTIIREYSYPTTISYLANDSCGYFVYADASLSAIYSPMDAKYNITDFVIDNDSVFFCGVNSKGRGFVGFFDINDFFFGSNSYFVDNNVIQTFLSEVSDLTKLVSYTDVSNVRHIVSIGTTLLGQYCVVNVTRNGASSAWNYETGEIPLSSPETLSDIKLSDDYVFTGGMYRDDTLNPNLVIRVYDKPAVFDLPTGIQNYANELMDVTSLRSFCFEDVALLKYSCNEVYVAAYWKFHQDTGTVSPVIFQEPQGTYVGHYRLDKQKQIVQHMNSILVSHKYYRGGWKIYGFSKLNTSNITFNLLQEYENVGNGNIQSFVYELSNNNIVSALPFSFVTSEDYMFSGIDGHFAPPNYLMSGVSSSDKTILIYNMGQQGGNTCLDIKEIDPTPIDMVDVAHLAPFNVISNSVKFAEEKTNTSAIDIVIDCSAKQSER